MLVTSTRRSLGFKHEAVQYTIVPGAFPVQVPDSMQTRHDFNLAVKHKELVIHAPAKPEAKKTEDAPQKSTAKSKE